MPGWCSSPTSSKEKNTKVHQPDNNAEILSPMHTGRIPSVVFVPVCPRANPFVILVLHGRILSLFIYVRLSVKNCSPQTLPKNANSLPKSLFTQNCPFLTLKRNFFRGRFAPFLPKNEKPFDRLSLDWAVYCSN